MNKIEDQKRREASQDAVNEVDRMNKTSEEKRKTEAEIKRNQMVTIKKGTILIECKRSDLQMVDQTPDGIIINLKGGISIQYIDQYMEILVKEKIKAAIDHMSGNVKIDLHNYVTPARIENF